MRIIVENYKIECFETDRDYKLWLKDNSKDTQIVSNTIYHGEVYGIPQEIKTLFKDNVLVSIKRQCYNDTQYILIHK